MHVEARGNEVVAQGGVTMGRLDAAADVRSLRVARLELSETIVVFPLTFYKVHLE